MSPHVAVHNTNFVRWFRTRTYAAIMTSWLSSLKRRQRNGDEGSRTKEVLEHYEEKSIYMVGKHKI
ncbi:hypothetical protein SAMN05216428_101613 [Nitrosospira sp. Nsp11]|nr:hypothetical protein SAMN05216428_101613 [Nitrosospira sp. Nsp11]